MEIFESHPLDSIQITLDGQEDRHNKLRAMKSTKAPSFNTILQHIKLIAENMPQTELHVRVNIDKNNVEDYFLFEKTLTTWSTQIMLLCTQAL